MLVIRRLAPMRIETRGGEKSRWDEGSRAGCEGKPAPPYKEKAKERENPGTRRVILGTSGGFDGFDWRAASGNAKLRVAAYTRNPQPMMRAPNRSPFMPSTVSEPLSPVPGARVPMETLLRGWLPASRPEREIPVSILAREGAELLAVTNSSIRLNP